MKHRPSPTGAGAAASAVSPPGRPQTMLLPCAELEDSVIGGGTLGLLSARALAGSGVTTAVFGTPLDELPEQFWLRARNKLVVPRCFHYMLKWLERHDGWEQPGIFQARGNSSMIAAVSALAYHHHHR